MSTWFGQLETSLKANGKSSIAWEAGAGRLLLAPFAGRVLGCELPGVEGNLFWHHPDMQDQAKSAKVIKAVVPMGGDRLWLGPEIGFMWQDLEKARIAPFADYRLPAAIDPASWRITHDEQALIEMATPIEVTDYRTGRKISVNVQRRISVTQAPEGLPTGIKSVSFAIRNDIEVVGGDAGAAAGTWDILQIPSTPATGTLICPTMTPVETPRSYYSPFGPRHVRSDSRSVRFLVDGQRQIKMGLAPTQTTGRMGYHRAVGSVHTLIVRIFATLPGEPYVDLPLISDAFFGGDTLQAYNDDGGFGGFGEMEYHDPAVVVGCGPTRRSGNNITHVLAGSEVDIRVAARSLLGVEI